MNLPIEILMILVVIGFGGFMALIMSISKKIKLRRYKPENDKGKLAEDSRKRGFGDVQRTTLPQRRSLFQTTDNNPVVKNDGSDGKTGGSIRKVVPRNPFIRRR